jgi:hypothetical protein
MPDTVGVMLAGLVGSLREGLLALADGAEGPPPPVDGDEAEHAVLDPVPFAGAGRVVAHRDRQAGLGGQSGQLDFPGAVPVAVGTAGIGVDQQPVGVGEPGPAHQVPPPPDRLDGELGGVSDVADGDPAFVIGLVSPANRRRCFAEGR